MTTAQYYPIKGVNSQNEVKRRVDQLEKRLRAQVESAETGPASNASGPWGTADLGGDITAAGKALLDDADAAAQRATLGIGALPAFGSAEIDFGAAPVAEGTFTVSAAGVTGTSVVQCFIQADTTAGNDADAHRAAGRSFRMVPTPGTDSFSLDVQCLLGLCTGAFKVRYSHT